MLEGEEDVVVHLRAGPQPPQLGVHRGRRTEELEHLVDQMRAEVEQEPARVLGAPTFPPPVLVDHGAPALEARLEPRELAERPIGDQAPQRQEVTVPAPVVEDARHHAVLLGGVREPLGIRDARGQRLVYDEVQSRLHRGQPERHVLAVRRRHHNEVVRARGAE